MIARFYLWLFELLVAIDQLAHALLGGPKYLLFGGPCPSADETVSSKVGRQALQGRRWALVAEKLIDLIFLPWGKGHCRACIEFDELSAELRARLESMSR